MKLYVAKTLEEALEEASKELGKPVEELVYRVSDKKLGLIVKKLAVEVYELQDVVSFAEKYIIGITDALEIESSVKTTLEDDIIHINIDSDHNPILIGKNGVTLQALNELTKLAVSNHFRKKFRILLDISNYKDHKYSKLIHMARRFAKEVADTKVTYTFDPMPADERRAIHNAISNIEHVRSESKGEGKDRQVQIIYVD